MAVDIIGFHFRASTEAPSAEWAEKPHSFVHANDGFIFVERFESKSRPGTWLSVSYWRDAAALAAWRREAEHVKGMVAGKRDIFADYRIVVAEVMRDYSFAHKGEAALGA